MAIETIREKGWWSTATKDLGNFFYEAFWKTPQEKAETIFEMLLLVAGASRTIDFMKTMGQSGFMAVIALIYAEAGILIYEFLGYKAKRVKIKARAFGFFGSEIERYPIFNQKSVSRIGLIMHMIMTAIFTTSDIVLSNLKQALGEEYAIDETFAWALGFTIGFTFFMNLILLLIYKNTNPEFKLKEEMNELDYELNIRRLELDRTQKLLQMDFEEKQAPEFAEKSAKLLGQQKLAERFGETLGRDNVLKILQDKEGTTNAPPPPSSFQPEVKNNNTPNFP